MAFGDPPAYEVDRSTSAPTPTVRTPEADGRIPVKLLKPITFGSEVITELRFRPTTAKDMRSLPLEGTTMGHLIDIAGLLCGQPPAVMDKIEGADLMEVVALVKFF